MFTGMKLVDCALQIFCTYFLSAWSVSYWESCAKISHDNRRFLLCVLSSQRRSHPASPSSQGPIVLGRKQKALQKNRSADFNPDFVFTEKEGAYDGSWAMADVMSQLKKKVRTDSDRQFRAVGC